MIAIVDYGMGNLRSVEKALQKLGHVAVVTSDAAQIRDAERVILPGVGAFGAAMRNLQHRNGLHGSLAECVVESARSGKPFLGICLGMQLLLTTSEEIGSHQGLNLIPGCVLQMVANGDPELKIPHMGWNKLHFPSPCPLFAGLEEGSAVYFVHSFYCVPGDASICAATASHGIRFCAAIRKNNVFATQFHPEKSGSIGLQILDNFARFAD